MALQEVAKANYPKIMPEVRAGIEAFIAGINDYMDAHRNEVPGWWGTRRVEKHLPVAFGRQYIWGWPSGQAFDDLRATGLRPNFTDDMRASNEMAVAPSRSAEGVPMLIIDPHLGWFGRRFWSYDFTLARFTVIPSPRAFFSSALDTHRMWRGRSRRSGYGGHLHTRAESKKDCAVSLRRHLARDSSSKVLIRVKDEEKPREVTFYDTHNGPIVAKKGNTAYAAKLAYADDVGYIEGNISSISRRTTRVR